MRLENTVGILAWNKHSITNKCLQRIRESNFNGEIILIDNGSSPALDEIGKTYKCTIIRNEKNQFVNPMWNLMFNYCKTRYLTLLNNDCLVNNGYLSEVQYFMEQSDAGLLSCSFIRIEDMLAFENNFTQENTPPIFDYCSPKDGHLMTIDLMKYRKCRYHIPSVFKIWFGDDWIWGQLRKNGYKCGIVKNRSYFREESVTIRANPGLNKILDFEKKMAFNSYLLQQLRIIADASGVDHTLSCNSKHDLTNRIRLIFYYLKDWITLR